MQPVTGQNWLVLTDPTWTPSSPGEQPPPAAMVGGWPLDDEGRAGPFLPSPEFVVSGPNTPTDPCDAVLRLIGRGQQVADRLVPALLDVVVEIAVDQAGRPLVGADPDGVPCVAVATAPMHRNGIGVFRWRQVVGADLVHVVPRGADIMLNPAGPATVRLHTAALTR